MLDSLIRTKTFWGLVVVLLGYGIITWDEGDPSPGRVPEAQLSEGMAGQYGNDDTIPGYGDITWSHLDATNGGFLARCAAVVH